MIYKKVVSSPSGRIATTVIGFFMAAICSVCAQNSLQPANNVFAMNKLTSGHTEMAYFAVSAGKMTEIGSFSFDIVATGKTVAIYTLLRFVNAEDTWRDTCIADGNSFEPIYRSSYSKDLEYVIRYGGQVNGHYTDRKTKKTQLIKEALTQPVFDSYSYPYFLGLLPLSAGYKKDLPVYEFKPGNKTNITATKIEEVKSNSYQSSISGEHKVWQVSVFEETSNDRYEYYIDKDTRQLWKIEVLAKGQKLLLLAKEPETGQMLQAFNKAATMKLLKEGSAVISGQVFARDNHNDGALKGMAVLNVNKKQYAKAGTSVILIPYTAFFKEWIKLNEDSRKKGRAIPLPGEAAECIKVAPVFDSEGHFEFVNLMPGEYLIYTEFGYTHTGVKTEVTGYTDTYINGMFQGSRENTTSYGYSSNASAAVKKIVTIEKEGEKLTVKLKKTL